MTEVRNIAAVVITFNRLEFLKEVIECLRGQTIKVDKIIVVNNSSSDGTKEWLNIQNDLLTIEQGNTGSSGGQFTGIKKLFDLGYEWIWTMDDDVIHEPDCLENLMRNINMNRIHAPLRYDNTGKPFLNDVRHFNMINPFKTMWQGVLTSDDIQDEYIKAEGITFEGPVFHRSLVEKVGLPDKNFFIYGDDTEYFIRAKKNNYDIYVVRDARSHRKLPALETIEKFTWKHYNIIRNIIAIDVMHGTLAVRVIRPIGYFLKWVFRCKSLKDLKTTIKAFLDGYFYKPKN